MKIRKQYTFLVCLSLCFGCGNKTGTKADSCNSIQTENDTLVVNDRNDHDWAPEEFKKEHYDEWLVVKPAINIQQQKGEINFSQIHKLVEGYINKKKISLPKDKYQRILKIEEICRSRFDISGYDDSNMGMHIADGTAELFEEYVNWLLLQEANKAKRIGINLTKEEEVLQPLMDAFYMCCDSIGYAFGGSGGWMGSTEVYRIQISFRRSMYEAIICPKTSKELPYLLTPKHFEEECKLRIANYKKDWDEATEPEMVKTYLDNYALAIKNWLLFRSMVEAKLTDNNLKNRYSYITRKFAREQYIHLKNEFGDIGICSASMYDECYLHLDCTDEAMLSYNYEKAYRKYMSK